MKKKKTSIKSVDEVMKDTITAITVRGFKCFATEQSIELRPLTILAGANSSGKSSIVQPLLLLKQTIESSFDPGPLLLKGPNVKFDYADQLFSRLPDGSTAKDIRFRIELGNNECVNYGFGLIKRSRERKKVKLTSFSFSFMAGKAGSNLSKPATKIRHEPKLPVLFKHVSALRRNLEFLDHVKGEHSLEEADTLIDLHVALYRFIHVPGYRGNPQRTYPATATEMGFSGLFQDYIASIIEEWQKLGRKEHGHLNAMLRLAGLAWKVEARYVDDTSLALMVARILKPTRGRTHDFVNIADVGFGVSQVMPVLVALLTAQPGQIVYIEEPEIHLHPNAQYIMARILAEAALRGVVVIAETHSTFILRGIQTLVTKGELPTDYVKLHWFTRNPKDGTSTVRSADLDKMGAWGDWPEDFDEVSFRVEKELLDERDLKRWGT